MKLFKIFEDGSCAIPLVEDCDSTERLLEATQQMYLRVGYQEPWVAYVAVKDNRIAGTCAFKSAPTNNKVEIAYFTLPQFQGQGIGSKMVEALISIARSENPRLTITAQTLSEENASNSILKKFGFSLERVILHPEGGESWEWHLILQNNVYLN